MVSTALDRARGRREHRKQQFKVVFDFRPIGFISP